MSRNNSLGSLTGLPDAPDGVPQPASKFAVLNPRREEIVLKRFKQQRKLGLFPSAAFEYAARDMEWIPATQKPTKPPIRELLSEDEVERLTKVHTRILPHDSSPYRLKSSSFRLSAKDVPVANKHIEDFLARHKLSADPEMYRYKVGARLHPCILTTHIAADQAEAIKKLKRRDLPRTHPLYGHFPPFALNQIPDNPVKDKKYPYRGTLLLNFASAADAQKSTSVWTGIGRVDKTDLEVIPNSSDMHLYTMLHEIGHIAQNEAREYRGLNYETDYHLEFGAEIYALEGYRKLGATQGMIEMMIAVCAARFGVGRQQSKEFSDYQPYWHMGAWLNGKDGHLKWPLYRIAAAGTEIRYIAAAHNLGATLDYDSHFLNSALRETYLRLRDIPAQKSRTFFNYQDIERTFNRVTRAMPRSSAETSTMAAFNQYSRLNRRLQGDKFKRTRPQRLMSAYRDIWFSELPLNDNALLVLGLALEGCALFRPSLRQRRTSGPTEFNFQRCA